MKSKSNNTKSNGNKTRKRPATIAVVTAPVAASSVMRNQRPTINGKDSFVVSRREFCGTLTAATTGFSLTEISKQDNGYDLNPSCPFLFPWLSGIARNFERFRFKKLAFDVVANMPSTTGGTMYAAVDYDFDDAVATNELTMMNNADAVSGPLWKNFRLQANPASLNRDLPYRYIASTGRSVVDNRTAYAGFLMIAFTCAATPCTAQLYVDYEVELTTPSTDEMVHQDILPTAPFPSSAGLTTVVGGQNVGLVPLAEATFPPGPIKIVVPGTVGTPVMRTIYGAGTLLHDLAISLVGAKRAGVLELMTNFLVTGISPATILSNVVNVVYSIFDSKGNYLSGLTGIGTSHGSYPMAIGPLTPADIATVGHTVVHKISTDLDQLLASFPQAAYLAPQIVSGVGMGAGNKGLFVKYSV